MIVLGGGEVGIPFGVALHASLLRSPRVGELPFDCSPDVVDPGRNGAAGLSLMRRLRRRHGWHQVRRSVCVQKMAALGRGGDVSSVDSEDRLEHVAGGVGVGGVGDDVNLVAGAAAGGTDVEAASGGGSGRQLDADGDGVALVAVFGGGITEPDMVDDVVGRQHDSCVARRCGGGDRSVGVDVVNGPQLAVADGY